MVTRDVEERRSLRRRAATKPPPLPVAVTRVGSRLKMRREFGR